MLSRAYWLMEVWRQFPCMTAMYPLGPSSIRDDELAVYIMHIKTREQIEERAATERLRRVMTADIR